MKDLERLRERVAELLRTEKDLTETEATQWLSLRHVDIQRSAMRFLGAEIRKTKKPLDDSAKNEIINIAALYWVERIGVRIDAQRAANRVPEAQKYDRKPYWS